MSREVKRNVEYLVLNIVVTLLTVIALSLFMWKLSEINQ